MGKFLDQSGLNYLWSKLKTKLDGKVSKSGDTLTGDLKIQKTIPELGLNSGNGRTRIFKNANAEADYGSSFGDILADEKTSVYLELHADSKPAGVAKLKHVDSAGTPKEYKLFHEGNPDPGSAKSDYGMLSVPDILAWASEQIRSGSFAVAKNTTTANLPVANTYYIGFLDVTGDAAARRIMLTNRVTGDTFVNATYNSAWIGWKQVSASDTKSVAWENVSGKPETFPPDKHTHSVSRTISLPTASWSGNAQTVSVSDVLADETAQLIQPVPAIASQAAYIDAGIRCIGQAAGKLTFTCDKVPTANLTVYIVITPLTDNAGGVR